MAHLIDKDAVVAEIERRKNLCEKIALDLRNQENKDYYQGKAELCKETIDHLDTLEVKEVDLEKEYKDFIKSDNGRSMFETAKHFFELGVNKSNPLTWEDMKLIWNITDEMDNMPEEEFYKEVLKRFKAQKGKRNDNRRH